MSVSVPHSLCTLTSTAPQISLSYTSGDERDRDEASYDEDVAGEEEELVEDDEDASMAASELSNSSSAFTPSSNSWRSHCGPAAPRTCQARKLPPLTDLALSSFLESRDEDHSDFIKSHLILRLFTCTSASANSRVQLREKRYFRVSTTD